MFGSPPRAIIGLMIMGLLLFLFSSTLRGSAIAKTDPLLQAPASTPLPTAVAQVQRRAWLPAVNGPDAYADEEPPPPPESGIQIAAISAIAQAETVPVPHTGDASDDPAIWIHPTNPELSTIIGTDKTSGTNGGGLLVYDLSGNELQYVSVGGINNVDLRYNFPLGGQPTDLVVGSNKRYNSIDAYRVNPQTRRLENVSANVAGLTTGFRAYGLCMYRSPFSGKYYVFMNKQPLNSEDTGEYQQWELFDNGSGKVTGQKVRTFYVGSDSEGCVADDVTGALYIANTSVGVWKYAAEPNAGDTRTSIATSGTAELGQGLEGITLYYTGQQTGYLIVSSQGRNSFSVFRRETNTSGQHEFVTSFKVAAGNGIDAVEDTDGIDVTNVNLGPLFPQGMFVAQDGINDTGNTNFKLVPWQSIAGSTLAINTSWNPRQIGAGPQPTVTATPPTATPAPTAIALPGRFEVEDYRAGGQNVGYSDSTAGNSGGQYRADDVDIQVTSDSTGRYNVGWITAGEWLAYDVNVATTGAYRFTIRAATSNTARQIHLEVDGVNVSGPITLPVTGGFQTWADVTSPAINLQAGPHTLRIVADTSSFNLNYVTVAADASNTPTSTSTATSTPIPTTTPSATSTATPTSTAPPTSTPTNTALPTATPTATGTATTSTITVIAEADAQVQQANPNSNYGKLTTLRVDGGTDPLVESYLRFSVAGVTGSIQSVKLRVYSSTYSAAGAALYTSPTGWSETAVTWNNRPARSTSAVDTKIPVRTGTWTEYNVTPVVAGDGAYSFVLATTNTDGVTFSSREGVNPAQLVVTYNK